ncbi:hypothetical protein X759_35195 [Mesorhizobium sp. LSHC420B00]|nr:hypothetical protein X759_35195 [Mesorhizobium sp. LSHC420B00]
MPCFFRSRVSNRLAALAVAASLDDLVKHITVLIDGAHSQCFLPAMVMTTSSRCHASFRLGFLR